MTGKPQQRSRDERRRIANIRHEFLPPFDARLTDGQNIVQQQTEHIVARPLPDRTNLPATTMDKPPVTLSHDDDEQHWNPRGRRSLSSPASDTVVPPALSTTVSSRGFDVNRSANEQTPSSFTSNNNVDNSHAHHAILRARKDYDKRLVDISSLSSSSHLPNVQLRRPTLTRHQNGNEFAAVDRLALGPSRSAHADMYYQSDESLQQPSPMTSFDPSRLKSIEDSTFYPSQQQQQPHLSPQDHRRTQTEQELIAWQSRMLERDHRTSNTSPKPIGKRSRFNNPRASNRHLGTPTRSTSVMSNMSGSQRFENEHHEPMIKSARVIKRYIELLYHLQTFYDRMVEQLFHGNAYLRNNLPFQSPSSSIFVSHCRKIAEQLQYTKPMWERKLVDLETMLKDLTLLDWSTGQTETTFLQRRSTLMRLMQTLKIHQDADETYQSILMDIERVLHEEKLAFQLQDELSTLLQHQSLLNDFTSLLQWNRQIYSSHEQNRVENVLIFLREQMITTDGYVSHVSQQLTELVNSLRSMERYILSYTNSVSPFDDGMAPSRQISLNRNHRRRYNDADIDLMKPKESHMDHVQRNDTFDRSHENTSKTRSVSMSRFTNTDEFNHHLGRNDLRASTKRSPFDTNTNNSNNNRASMRIPALNSANSTDGLVRPAVHRSASSGRYNNSAPLSIHDPEVWQPNQVESTHRKEGKTRGKDEGQKAPPKQSLQVVDDYDFHDGDMHSSYNQRQYYQPTEQVENPRSEVVDEPQERTHTSTERRRARRLQRAADHHS